MVRTHTSDAVSTTRDTVDPKFLEAMERLASYNTTPPEGAFTKEDAAEQWNVNPNTASKRLMRMHEEGIVDRISMLNNKMYYWFKE